jgi:hypothetical protein
VEEVRRVYHTEADRRAARLRSYYTHRAANREKRNERARAKRGSKRRNVMIHDSPPEARPPPELIADRDRRFSVVPTPNQLVLGDPVR